MNLKNIWTFATFVRLALAFVILGVIIFYALYQARFLISGPTITLLSDLPSISNEPSVQIAGIAENIIALSLNGRPLYTDERGHFDETLVLQTGYTLVTIMARDRYGNEVVVERNIVYQPKS